MTQEIISDQWTRPVVYHSLTEESRQLLNADGHEVIELRKGGLSWKATPEFVAKYNNLIRLYEILQNDEAQACEDVRHKWEEKLQIRNEWDNYKVRDVGRQAKRRKYLRFQDKLGEYNEAIKKRDHIRSKLHQWTLTCKDLLDTIPYAPSAYHASHINNDYAQKSGSTNESMACGSSMDNSFLWNPAASPFLPGGYGILAAPAWPQPYQLQDWRYDWYEVEPSKCSGSVVFPAQYGLTYQEPGWVFFPPVTSYAQQVQTQRCHSTESLTPTATFTRSRGSASEGPTDTSSSSLAETDEERSEVGSDNECYKGKSDGECSDAGTLCSRQLSISTKVRMKEDVPWSMEKSASHRRTVSEELPSSTIAYFEDVVAA